MKFFNSTIPLLLSLFLIVACGEDAPTEDKAKELIAQLSDPNYKKREQATEELVKMAEKALPELERNMDNEDPEIKERVRFLLLYILNDVVNLNESNGKKEIKKFIDETPKRNISFLLSNIEENSHRENYHDALAAVLRDNNHPEIYPVFIELYVKDPQEFAFVVIVLNKSESIPPLKKKLIDTAADSEQRKHAAEVLGGHSDKNAIDVLINQLDIESEIDGFGQKAVLWGLRGAMGKWINISKAPTRKKEAEECIEKIQKALIDYVESKPEKDLEDEAILILELLEA